MLNAVINLSCVFNFIVFSFTNLKFFTYLLVLAYYLINIIRTGSYFIYYLNVTLPTLNIIYLCLCIQL